MPTSDQNIAFAVQRGAHVPAGFDVADDKIVGLVEAGDLIITADIAG